MATDSPTTNSAQERVIRIYAGQLFDPESLQLQPRQRITVSQDSGLILDVRPYSIPEESEVDFTNPETVVDLRDATVLPGFVDTHVHMFLHPYAETTWEDQLTKESLVERTVRATVHAKRTLMAGFTTVRDLGTEGAEDADIQLRKCMSGPNPLIPGPRYFCANRAIIASGSYGECPKSNLHLHQQGVEGVTGAEFVDGEAECMKAVRKQVGAGADWVKVLYTVLQISLSRKQSAHQTFRTCRYTQTIAYALACRMYQPTQLPRPSKHSRPTR
ncbi:hypothetical protein ONZ51_g11706 [Trametes cubensis]|uniref:Amidohydrolase-related domain-containing protein n=1 Tax=Trametes cubensis TaxID=1111947 RepID=A0AAD7THG7_9APHY|nr:hypothetical protein ONZ51_g11706 [Trametes cubensis]